MLWRDNIHAIYKKIFLVFLSSFIAFTFVLIVPYQQSVQAALYSKPLTITAKKVAKELAIDSAVAMAEHILFEKALNEFLDSDLRAGYTGACLDDYRTFEDCPPDKRVQIKTDFDNDDKKKLSNSVENVIEKKTNTSSKWAKFLDWFIPIFLISGLVSAFESLMDSDSESLMDEIGQEALIQSGLMLPLLPNSFVDGSLGYDFDSVLQSYNVTPIEKGFEIFLTTKSDVRIIIATVSPNGYKKTYYISNSRRLTYTLGANSFKEGANYRIYGSPEVYWDGDGYNSPKLPFDRTYATNTLDDAFSLAYLDFKSLNASRVSSFNGIIAAYVTGGFTVTITGVETIKEVKTDYGTQTGIDKIKDETGNLKIPGIDSFKYTDQTTKKVVYPSDESTTGWKDKLTNEDIVVSEDDITVESKTETETDPDTEPENPPDKTEEDLDQLGKNLPLELILALLDMLRSILYFMVRLSTFIVTIPMLPAVPIPNEVVMWFFNVQILGIYVMDLARTLVSAALGMSVYRIVKKVF